MPIRFLISRQQYLASGLYIGTKQKTADMKDFVAEVRPDGLALFNLKKVDERIRTAASLLNKSRNVLIASRKRIAFPALEEFRKVSSARIVAGRFMPGTLTNPTYENFFEADWVFVVDPMTDYRVVEEAVKAQIPVMAICNSFNETRNIDYVIPANNGSRRSIAMLFWMMGREMQKERGEIQNDREYSYRVEDFEGVPRGEGSAMMEEYVEEEAEEGEPEKIGY